MNRNATRPAPDNRPHAERPRHTDADPSRVHNEADVPNERHALPSDKLSANLVAAGAAIVAVLGLLLAFGVQLDVVGFVVAIVAILAGVVSVFMAAGDARATTTLPWAATVLASVVAVVLLFDVLETENATRDGVTTPGEVLAGQDGDAPEALDGDANLGYVPDDAEPANLPEGLDGDADLTAEDAGN